MERIKKSSLNTTQRVADVLTKGAFSQEHWPLLTQLVPMTHQTHGSSPALVLTCLGENMSTMNNEQVSAKSKPVRGLCLLKRNDGPEAINKRSQRRLFPPDRECSFCCGLHRCSFVAISFSEWELMIARKERDGNRRRRRFGWQVKCAQRGHH